MSRHGYHYDSCALTGGLRTALSMLNPAWHGGQRDCRALEDRGGLRPCVPRQSARGKTQEVPQQPASTKTPIFRASCIVLPITFWSAEVPVMHPARSTSWVPLQRQGAKRRWTRNARNRALRKTVRGAPSLTGESRLSFFSTIPKSNRVFREINSSHSSSGSCRGFVPVAF